MIKTPTRTEDKKMESRRCICAVARWWPKQMDEQMHLNPLLHSIMVLCGFDYSAYVEYYILTINSTCFFTQDCWELHDGKDPPRERMRRRAISETLGLIDSL